MKYIHNIDWDLMWSIFKDVIIPHSGRLIFNIIIFLIIGFFLSVIIVFVLSKKNIFKRKPKYYNWLVKLYIPILVVVFLYIFGQIGFFRGVYKILENETEPIVISIYDKTLSFTFNSEESKNSFVTKIQASTKQVKDGTNYLITQIQKTTLDYNSGISLIDTNKNKISNYLIEEYGTNIYKAALYGMLDVAGENIEIDINDSMSYDEFSAAIDFLLNVKYDDIEVAIKRKLIVWFNSLLNAQYNSIIKSLLILLFIILSIPVIEFLVYIKWIEPKFINNKE